MSFTSSERARASASAVACSVRIAFFATSEIEISPDSVLVADSINEGPFSFIRTEHY